MTPPATRKRAASSSDATTSTARKRTAKKATAKKTTARKTAAKKTAAKKTAAKRSGARRTTAARTRSPEVRERRPAPTDETSRSEPDRASGSSGPARPEVRERTRSSGRSGSGSGSGERRVAASVAARRAAQEFGELTSTPVERVVAVRRTDDGWTVQVEALELRRTPPTMDVMGLYEVQLSSRGQVAGWDRLTRYHRSQVEGS
jgi:hypothetical protein